MPKRVKVPKVHPPAVAGSVASRGNHINFGDYGLQAMEPAGSVPARSRPPRRAIVHYLRRGGKLWIRVSRIMR